jgi:hypothetical protein
MEVKGHTVCLAINGGRAATDPRIVHHVDLIDGRHAAGIII